MFRLVLNPPPYFEAEYCLFCGRRRVAVARYRMICLVLRYQSFNFFKYIHYSTHSLLIHIFDKISKYYALLLLISIFLCCVLRSIYESVLPVPLWSSFCLLLHFCHWCFTCEKYEESLLPFHWRYNAGFALQIRQNNSVAIMLLQFLFLLKGRASLQQCQLQWTVRFLASQPSFYIIKLRSAPYWRSFHTAIGISSKLLWNSSEGSDGAVILSVLSTHHGLSINKITKSLNEK